MKKISAGIILCCGLVMSSQAQIELEWTDTTSQTDYSSMYFFTNRPAIISDSDLLSSMMRDTSFMNNIPYDFTVGLLCTSMGNELLKRFVLKADERGIELHKTYSHIMMIGSDASWDSFEEGKGFDRHGPRRPWKMPDFVQVFDITGYLVREDLAKLNHDYLLRNPYFQEMLLQDREDPEEH